MSKPSRETLATALAVATWAKVVDATDLAILGIHRAPHEFVEQHEETARAKAREIIADAILGPYEPEDDGR